MTLDPVKKKKKLRTNNSSVEDCSLSKTIIGSFISTARIHTQMRQVATKSVEI